MTFLTCIPLTVELLPLALALDQSVLGGLWTADGYQREIDSPNSDLLVLMSSSTQQIRADSTILGMGCLWAILDEAHITTLAIAPDYHRQKLGQLVLLQLLYAARRRGLTHATLEVRISNTAAINLYEKFGFKTAGQRKKYYRNDEDALILWRSGIQGTPYWAQLKQAEKDCLSEIKSRNWQWVGPTLTEAKCP